MNMAQMVDQLLLVPYVPGAGEMHGADCWGIVELWFKHVLGIDLEDRASNPSGHEGMQSGFDTATRWHPIVEPENHCIVIMRAGGLKAGHVGIFYDGKLLHSDESHGCVYQPLSDRFIRSKITGFLKYK